mmetsp:Transcript_126160/g.353267  ORF Transcript_126160/g.353267 Transcript_126160/m.353267 type:complete len:212 (-) Transcript_126160:108-743(-)
MGRAEAVGDAAPCGAQRPRRGRPAGSRRSVCPRTHRRSAAAPRPVVAGAGAAPSPLPATGDGSRAPAAVVPDGGPGAGRPQRQGHPRQRPRVGGRCGRRVGALRVCAGHAAVAGRRRQERPPGDARRAHGLRRPRLGGPPDAAQRQCLQPRRRSGRQRLLGRQRRVRGVRETHVRAGGRTWRRAGWTQRAGELRRRGHGLGRPGVHRRRRF